LLFAHGGIDLVDGHAVRPQGVGIDIDLVFAHMAADGGDLADALGGEQAIAHVPVLHAAQLVQVPPADRDVAVGSRPSSVYQKTCPRAVASGPSAGWTPAGSPGRQAVEFFDDACPCPVELDVLVEDQEDQRGAEHGRAAHFVHAGDAHQAT
jgi:hypothetical protein